MAKYLDQAGAQHFAEALIGSTKTINGESIWGSGNMVVSGSNYIADTYANIKALVDSKSLTAGYYYAITDYRAVGNASIDIATSGTNPQMHILVLRALSSRALDPHGYIVDSNPNSNNASGMYITHEVLYDINNNTNLYSWATPNSKGIIYWMKDLATNNEAGFDFRNDGGLKNLDMVGSAYDINLFNGETTNCKVGSICVNGKYYIPSVAIFDSTYVNIAPHTSWTPSGATTTIYIDSCEYVNIGPGAAGWNITSSRNINIGGLYGSLGGEISTIDACYDINLGDNNTSIFLQGCQNVCIKNKCSNILIKSGSEIQIGNVCKNIFLSNDNSADALYTFDNQNITIGDNCVLAPTFDISTSSDLFSVFHMQNVTFEHGCTLLAMRAADTTVVTTNTNGGGKVIGIYNSTFTSNGTYVFKYPSGGIPSAYNNCTFTAPMVTATNNVINLSQPTPTAWANNGKDILTVYFYNGKWYSRPLYAASLSGQVTYPIQTDRTYIFR